MIFYSRLILSEINLDEKGGMKNLGPGSRVYYGLDGGSLVILLTGGTKRRQARDIEKAQACWKAYRQEKRHARKRS